MNKLLPEQESEDEKIRKRLVEYFNGYYDKFSSRNNVNVHWESLEVKAVITYLENLRREDTEREYNGDNNVNPKRYTVMIDKLKSFL